MLSFANFALEVTSCNRFRHEDVRVQRRHIVGTLLEALQSIGRTTDRLATYYTDGDSRRSKEMILSYYPALRYLPHRIFCFALCNFAKPCL